MFLIVLDHKPVRRNLFDYLSNFEVYQLSRVSKLGYISCLDELCNRHHVDIYFWCSKRKVKTFKNTHEYCYCVSFSIDTLCKRISEILYLFSRMRKTKVLDELIKDNIIESRAGTITIGKEFSLNDLSSLSDIDILQPEKSFVFDLKSDVFQERNNYFKIFVPEKLYINSSFCQSWISDKKLVIDSSSVPVIKDTSLRVCIVDFIHRFTT